MNWCVFQTLLLLIHSRSIPFALQGLKAEELLSKERTKHAKQTQAFESFKDNIHRDVLEELRGHEEGGQEEDEGELEEEEGEGEEGEEGEATSHVAAPVHLSHQPKVSAHPSQGNQDDDSVFDGSENFSMDANTAGTSSNKVSGHMFGFFPPPIAG